MERVKLLDRMRGAPDAALQHPHGGRLCPVGQALHSLSSKETSERDGVRGDQPVPHASGCSAAWAASTQSQALAAILFLYRDVLGEEVPWLTELVRAPRRERAPVVLTREEVRRLLGQMSGTAQLVARLLYGTGMRLLEGLRLRVKDLDFETGEVVVRAGKGNKDRTTTLPRVLSVGLERHLERVRAMHDRDVSEGFGRVWMPDAFEVKYPNANASWSW